MNEEPLVSIGVPTFNRPKTLKRALSSLVSQTYKNLEIIVSDNYSTDKEVLEVMNEFKIDSRIRFFKQPINYGLTFNFNFLLNKATGNYFMWLADDDWLDTNYIEECINFLLKHPDYLGVYGLGKIHALDEQFLNFDLEIDLEQNSGDERVKLFLNTVITNGCFSALVPTKYKSELIMKDVIATDWLVVSRIAFSGKFKMLRSTSTHISCGGLSSTTEGLTRNMPVFTRSFPYLSIALNVAYDILFGSKVYTHFNYYKRMVFAKECFLIVYRRHLVRNEIRPGFKKLINFNKQGIKSLSNRFTRSK